MKLKAKKGQLSFDLILAVLLAIILMQSTLIISDSITSSENSQNIMNQEFYIALNVLKTIELGKTMKETNEKIEYVIPKIKVFGSKEIFEKELDAGVSISNDKITVSATEPKSGKKIEKTISIASSGITLSKNSAFKIICANHQTEGLKCI